MDTFCRVIVLGFDGLEPTIVDSMLQAGRLPNFARMKERGGYSRVQTTYPAQTPVAWSTFATGLNPGGHGIFDFIRRDPQVYLPRLAFNTYQQKNAFTAPTAVNLRRGTPIWRHLSDAGIPSTILRCPCTFPPDHFRGRMLSGMGVPDVRGGLGTPTFYTTDTSIQAGESEIVVHVNFADGERMDTHLIGPRHPRTRADAHLPLRLQVDRAGRRVVVRSSGEPQELEIAEREWSDWLTVRFKLGLFQSVRGAVRFFLKSIEPEFALYASPVNFDCRAPMFPVSSPDDFAGELSDSIGLFHTAGMVEDHTGLSNGRFDEHAFLRQCADVWRERESMLLHELQRGENGLFFCLFDTPDRVQHMFWRFRESSHPANRAGSENGPYNEFSNVIEEEYRRCDAVVGNVLEFVDDSTLLIALSDHGFGSFRRGVNLNTWLHQKGLLFLKPGTQPGAETAEFFNGVDWSRTKAYSLGLGGVYFNRAGREGEGIVDEAEADSLGRHLAEELTGLIDDEQQAIAVRSVVPRSRVYSGASVGNAPDLLVNFSRGYRASWGNSLGGLSETVFEDNVKRWAGDHIVDPAEVPGVLFTNKPVCSDRPGLLDMAPTISAALGVKPAPAMEGQPILS